MIVVKIELHSAITGTVKELGRMVISNDGDHKEHPKKGNYTARVCKKGSTNFMKPTRTGKVRNYSRNSYTVWKLVYKALKECFAKDFK